MSIDPVTFRQTVGQFVTGVTVIAMEVDGSIRAMTANSFTSLSLNPPLVLFCLGKGTKAGQLIHQVTGFSVNILSQEQQPLSSYFAGAWKGVAAAFSFTRSEGGPRLDGSVAALGCRSTRSTKAAITGSSSVRSSRSIAMSCRATPLVFFGGRYSALAGEVGEEAGLLIAGLSRESMNVNAMVEGAVEERLGVGNRAQSRGRAQDHMLEGVDRLVDLVGRARPG